MSCMNTGHLEPTQSVYDVITRLLAREGGFVDHPYDRGGATNMGITIHTLSLHRNIDCTPEDVACLSEDEARDIYYQSYWVRPGFSTLDLHPVLVELIFDTAVHSGARTAVKMLQTVVGVTTDGVLGKVTRTAASQLDQLDLACRFLAHRMSYLGRLITKYPNQSVFAHGWYNRLGELLRHFPEISHTSHE